jgi:dihydrofolate reductase
VKKIVYYVASSIDGFISGVDGDISGFAQGGTGVEKYHNDLKDFKTIIMGRNTYEFGYQYGLVPGTPAYPHMDHFIFSKTISFENPHEKINVVDIDLDEISRIRKESSTDIYLCGGGKFAGWLLENEQIDILKIKLNPLILGQGIKMFGNSTKNYTAELINSKKYDNELIINTYCIKY